MEIIMKKMLFVFNPNSGKAQIKNSLLKIIQIFSNADYEVTVYPTKAALIQRHLIKMFILHQQAISVMLSLKSDVYAYSLHLQTLSI